MRSAWTRLGAACIASCLALGIYLWVSSRPYVPPLYVHSKDAKLAMSGNAPTPKMYYVAMCAGEYDIASLVEEELLTHHSVHKIIYVETAYNFRDGSPKKLHNCSGRSKYPGRVSTHVAYVEEKDRALCDQAAWAESYNKGSASVFRSKASYCYENMGRNEEARAFELAGGGAHDIAVLADVDEIPDTAALAQLRTWPPDHGVSVKLQAIHHYKYNLGCERSGLPADQLHHRGPVAVLGQTLFDVGASAARIAVANGPVCFEGGYRASCTPLRERRIARSSWHMSSVDGGEDGNLEKLELMYQLKDKQGDAKQDDEAMRQHVRQVRRNCVEELGKEKTAIRFSKTAFGPNNVPKYPDVPHALDRALRDGRRRHMLDE